jgi:UPF0716 protein FxsA
VFQTLVILFLAVPLVEIYLLIKIGGVIGAWPTIGLVVFTAVLGAFLLRLQGLATLKRVQQTLARGELPATEMIEGAMLLASGALLLTPGFFTDTIGFICLVPAARKRIAVWALERFFIVRGGPAGGPGSPYQRHNHRVIKGDYRRDE